MMIVICFITILGGATLGHPPLGPVQMIWAILIMDILGTLAIGNEPPNYDTFGPRVNRRDKLILP